MSEMTYRQAGDYQIPNLQLENEGEKPLGKYGRMRRAFLEQNNPMLLNDMILTESLFPHLWEIEETAKARVEFLMEQYLKDSPAPDKETQQIHLRSAGNGKNAWGTSSDHLLYRCQ